MEKKEVPDYDPIGLIPVGHFTEWEFDPMPVYSQEAELYQVHQGCLSVIVLSFQEIPKVQNKAQEEIIQPEYACLTDDQHLLG